MVRTIASVDKQRPGRHAPLSRMHLHILTVRCCRSRTYRSSGPPKVKHLSATHLLAQMRPAGAPLAWAHAREACQRQRYAPFYFGLGMVLAVALLLATGRLAVRWEGALPC